MVHPRYRQTASPGARLSGKEKPSRSHAEERKKEDSRKPQVGPLNLLQAGGEKRAEKTRKTEETTLDPS